MAQKYVRFMIFRTYNILVEALLLSPCDLALRLFEQLILQRLFLLSALSLSLWKNLGRVCVILRDGMLLSGNDLVLALSWHKLGHDGGILEFEACARRARNFGGDSGALARAVAEPTPAAFAPHAMTLEPH